MVADAGWDPTYGARPLKRALQRLVENPLALRLLEGDFGDGDSVRVDVRDGELVFERAGTREPVALPEDHFGENVAAHYDDPGDPMFAPEAIDPVVDFLAPLAGDGRALELGIGTGRIAVPLPQRGVPVHGIDLSEAMVARLRTKTERRSRLRSATSRRRKSTARSGSRTSSTTRSRT